MPKRDNRNTYQAALRAQAKVAAARQELNTPRQAPAEEPMRRYPHPIPLPCACPCPDREQDRQCRCLTQVLEELQTQSQLLVGLTEAVNGLTAALLASHKPAAE